MIQTFYYQLSEEHYNNIDYKNITVIFFKRHLSIKYLKYSVKYHQKYLACIIQMSEKTVFPSYTRQLLAYRIKLL